jgi:hypothetical protein
VNGAAGAALRGDYDEWLVALSLFDLAGAVAGSLTMGTAT